MYGIAIKAMLRMLSVAGGDRHPTRFAGASICVVQFAHYSAYVRAGTLAT